MRVLLFTGKGGVGKSTVAAGTAALAAAAGQRTLVLSTDAAHSLADAFDVHAGSEPTLVAERLYVQQVDAQLRFEQSWAEIQGYLLSVLDVAGVDPVAAEELTVIPGAEEVLALLELRLQVRSGEWDVIVVDCAPTAETLRLLALPEALGWYMTRVFPVERRVVKTLRPVLSRAAGVPMPEDSVFDAVERLHRELDEVRALLSGPDGVRPAGADARAGRARRGTPLLHDAVPLRLPRRRRGRQPGVPGRRRRRLAGRLGDVPGRRARAGRGVLRRAARVAVGLPARRAGRRTGPQPSSPPSCTTATTRSRRRPATGRSAIDRTDRGAVLHLALPFVSRAEVDLARNGDELVITLRGADPGSGVGSYRRLLTLPAVLATLPDGRCAGRAR